MDRFRQFPSKLFWRIYYVLLFASLVLDVYFLYNHILHYHFSFQYFPQFFALLGFAGCILLILIAKAMGRFIVVDENYWQDKESKKEEAPID